MVDEKQTPQPPQAQPDANDAPAPAAARTHIAPSPHVGDRSRSTQGMMLDVLIALVPLMIVAIWVFRQYAIYVTVLCVGGCVATEAVFNALRRKPQSLPDCSAIVTGIILAMSLPWSCKWYVPVLAGVTASALGKMIFGGLGQNLFNPAMVGRAFVMICFAGAMGASAYVDKDNEFNNPALTGATPMTSYKQAAQAHSDEQADDAHDADEAAQPDEATPDSTAGEGEDSQPAPPARASLLSLFMGNVGGSLGETSALACIIGGAYLLIRRTAAWQIPLGVILAVVIVSGIAQLTGAEMTVLHHLFGGAVLFGAFYIATDPVSSPLTPLGRFIFGLGVGAFVMLLRLASNYPEGVMFAVLLMNALTPLLNRWTIPTPVGGPVPEKA